MYRSLPVFLLTITMMFALLPSGYPPAKASEKVARMQWWTHRSASTLQGWYANKTKTYGVPGGISNADEALAKKWNDTFREQIFWVYTKDEIDERFGTIAARVQGKLNDIRSSMRFRDERVNERIDYEVLTAIADLPSTILTQELKNEIRTSVVQQISSELEQMMIQIKNEILCEISDQHLDIEVSAAC